MEGKTEIVATTSNSPAEMIRMAVEGKADLGQLRELLSLQKEWEANEARKQYAQSFADAQAGIEGVVKNKVNPQTHSKYAALDAVIASAQPIYTKEGFSIIFYEGETTREEHIRVCADVLHRQGHKETFHFDVPLDGKGIQGNANMTRIHGKSSSVSYGRRYLMCMIWNIPTQDDDGNGATNHTKITDAQLHAIRDQLIALEEKEAVFCKLMKVEKLEDMLAADFGKAQATLNARKAQKSQVKK
jgi:hypothetical protein